MGMFDDLNNEPISGGGGMFADLVPAQSEKTMFQRLGDVSRGYDELKTN